MHIEKINIEGAYLARPTIHGDHRGYFYESYSEASWTPYIGVVHWIQDNQAFSRQGVLRGLHYQTAPHLQAKLIRALHGSIYDVIVDIRPDSPSYGTSYGVELSGENHLQLYVPRGCAHGYQVLSEEALIAYKCDALYAPAYEAGLRYDDPFLQIPWPLETDRDRLSERDVRWPHFGEHLAPYAPDHHG